MPAPTLAGVWGGGAGVQGTYQVPLIARWSSETSGNITLSKILLLKKKKKKVITNNQKQNKTKPTTKPAFLLNNVAWSGLISTLLHVVRPGYASGDCWDWGLANEVGISLEGGGPSLLLPPGASDKVWVPIATRQHIPVINIQAQLYLPWGPSGHQGSRNWRKRQKKCGKWEIRLPERVTLRHLEQIN